MNTSYLSHTTFHHFIPVSLKRICLLTMCWVLSLLVVRAQIVIGGDVYGGGLEGSVDNGTAGATQVVVNSGTVRTVFGGGRNGAVTGSTSVTINGGTIGDTTYEDTPYGGVYGGGEGAEATVTGSANVTVGGGDNYNNVYGGGKQANLIGNSNVVLHSGQVRGSVYAGARMANISGYALVDIVGDNTPGAAQLLVKAVYGGNDISGSITNPSVDNKPTSFDFKVTTGLSDALSSYVVARSTATNTFIGNVFGGGNGAYEYGGSEGNWSLTMTDPEAASGIVTFVGLPNKPLAPYAYLQIEGGTYGNIYGGGNNATITAQTDIYYGIGMTDGNYADVTPLSNIPAAVLDWLDLYEGYVENDNGTPADPSDDTFDMNYNALRIFGGNNLAEMSIRPTWHLTAGTVGNIYSGGNQGRMTYENGLLLPISSDNLYVNNVYGGCRMADVCPTKDGNPVTEIPEETYEGHTFPADYAARVYVTGGSINNVYGGNDVSGKVYLGTNVEIMGAISGDVYGGGNGSYAYTDNADWKTAYPQDADYYYDPGSNSLDSLYRKRPHVEKTLVHIGSDTEANRVIVAGNVYCGGNSATLAKEGDQSTAKAIFRIGKYVTMNGVFLGSNGENMIDSLILKKYAREENGVKFSSLQLTDSATFADYMRGVSVNIIPTIEWDADLDYTTRIGSFYCGGNVGSMTYDGIAGRKLDETTTALVWPEELVIFDKIVGGCNDANVAASEWNAAYSGGLVGNAGSNGTKVRMYVTPRLQPMKLTVTKNSAGFITDYDYDWNVTDTISYETFDNHTNRSRMFLGANVYGGCYQSGYVNGHVEIFVTNNIISDEVYDIDDLTDGINQAEVLGATGEYVYASALAVYGGGYGEKSSIRGNTTLTFSDQARCLLAFGGGEKGVVEGNTTVKLDADLLPTPLGSGSRIYNIYKVYAGGYEGNVEGNTTLNLAGGSVLRGFAGACNADIKGHTTAIVGCVQNQTLGLPYVGNGVFGGNDFGGQIAGSALHSVPVSATEKRNVRSQTYVEYQSGKIYKALYGGSYGSYNYAYQDAGGNNTLYPSLPAKNPSFETPVTKVAGDSSDVILSNTFVHIASQSLSDQDIIGSASAPELTGAFGGGRGYRNLPSYVAVDQTYVLLNASEHRTTPLADRIYGGGNLSTVSSTRVDAYEGSVNTIFGGTHGVMTVQLEDTVPYNVNETEVNLYGGIQYQSMNVFGAGANSGADSTFVNLYGGIMNDVHGGAYTEGYTPVTYIKVPVGSKARVNAIYGGGYGESDGRPCDVGISHISFEADSAKVEDAIYGGNHTARVTTQSYITLDVPLKNVAGELRDIYGGGYGLQTVSGFTRVDLNEGSEVANVYGGGRDGKVLNHYLYYNQADEAVNAYYSAAPHRHAHWTNAAIQPGSSEEQALPDTSNTLINIHPGALVRKNIYGGGYGKQAYTSGKTHIQLLGGTVEGDIYGGGYAGPMPLMIDTIHGYIAAENTNQTIRTLCTIDGGTVRNVFGGGYEGRIDGNTYVTIGRREGGNFLAGEPTIERSAYGGGEKAVVEGMSQVDMYAGYVGYYYYADADTCYKKLDLNEGDGLLKENGNLYGAGYGEGAVVMDARVNLFGGTVRNGLYGGGEIAAVGKGSVKFENEKYVLDQFEQGGATQVRIFGGLVEGDVFGGGRGFSYDLTGNQVIGTKYYTDGYVFGKTDVEIYRGTIGTDASLAEGHGNVFGGGNIGYVYGGSGNKASVSYTGETDATQIKFNGHYYTDDTWTTRSEDVRVHIAAMCVATGDVTIGGKTYHPGDTVSVGQLNKLYAAAPEWENLDTEGVTIRNAVFAGGNVSSGSDKIYANAVTVYGNATAAVVDVFSKDFISLGGDGIGGIYGDGNLTFVDGYRELNISNYGTDYYNMSEELQYEDYLKLSDREKGFYNLLYSPKENIIFVFDDVTYKYDAKTSDVPADEIDEHTYKTMLNAYVQMRSREMAAKWTESDGEYKPSEDIAFSLGGISYSYQQDIAVSATIYDEMMANYKTFVKEQMAVKWDINGECSLTAGRMMNTIQRADFCGMFGSRIMLYGAQDRVPDIVDYTKYTINRVGEVSLNQDTAFYDATEVHGNYFGIYNVVNFLGALTSDVEFTDPREADGCLEESLKADGKKYIEFKYDHFNERSRNMASSRNMVAQASGVFLELVKEKDEQGNKIYGPVTGVIQLDLINVKPGEGGGYVYAINQHGTPHPVSEDVKNHQTLSDANEGAYSYANYTYDSSLQPLQTSGNFVHPTKRIVDDCFPNGGYYDASKDGDNYSPAHYWYIRGDFYVYDQYISAYTGAAQAYTQDIDIPLTISAGSEGRMSLVSVNPNKYAYFVGKHYGDAVLTAQDSILVEETTFHLNDPISYWQWSQLSVTDQAYFVDSTYVSICDATIGGTDYAKGSVLLAEDYRLLATDAFVVDKKGETHVAPTDSVFRISNELSHEAGYLLTFDISNPLEWDDYYTKLIQGIQTESMLESAYLEGIHAGIIEAADYKEAPTLLCTQSGIYGQRPYAVDALVSQSVIDGQKTISESSIAAVQAAYETIKDSQAVFQPAYVVTADELSFTYGGKDHHIFVGSYIDQTMYQALDNSLQSGFEQAYICINTIEVADKDYILNGMLIPESRYQELLTETSNPANTFMSDKDLTRYFSNAYVCTIAGNFGGAYFEESKNYGALDFCGLPYAERNAQNTDNTPVFHFNKDAFDLLSTDFHTDITRYGEVYSSTQPVNYTATYNGKTTQIIKKRVGTAETYNGTVEEVSIEPGSVYQRVDYEAILNEKAHYMPINVTATDSTYYIVNETFEKANIYYPAGKVITATDYIMLSAQQKGNITPIAGTAFGSTGMYYYCVEAYKMSQESQAFTDCLNGSSYSYSGEGTTVAKGSMIVSASYDALPNYQADFTIHGHSPIQTTTIYVPRESDILNLSEDRVITVVYQYAYKEGDAGTITNYIEKHIVNIHIEFRSGQPAIGDVTPPATVLPNSTVGLSVPSVTRGAYEILGGGWEIFETESDANEHKNGVAYKNNATPMYWYQNNYYVAYYAKTYLGKTYSNPVPFSVANYHRIGEVMNHPKRMFIDHKDVDRASKIYLDAAAYPSTSIAADYHVLDSPEGKTDGKNDLDYLYDLYQETKAGQTSAADPYVFNPRIDNAANLEFILRSDIAPKKYAVTADNPAGWKSVGDSDDCFAGNFHGEGYTVTGLNNSLFGYLCGNVYNLGVTGSFTDGGVADHGGRIENAWIQTSGKPDAGVSAIVSDGSGVVINSYYPATAGYEAGQAVAKEAHAFLDGEVSYLLNRFYLHKRYSDHEVTAGKAYKAYLYNDDANTLTLTDGYYTADYATYTYREQNLGYVEDFYADGDYVYAAGEVPLTADMRYDDEVNMHYAVYPDDYIYFGQTLNFMNTWHGTTPTVVNKDAASGLLQTGFASNRVFRAPAYRGSGSIQAGNPVVHYNQNAFFAASYDSKTIDADLTAIDFTGHNDATYTGDGYYLPYLDYDGLGYFRATGLTKNLLVYAPDEATDAASHAVLSNALVEPTLSITEPDHAVAVANADTVNIMQGHLVGYDGSAYTATRNHFLVDKQDFNAPVSFTYAKNNVMWYQRQPQVFIDGAGGWETVALPFSADIVAGHEKGEVTHFYDDADDANNTYGFAEDKAHEYWLRAPQQAGTADGKTTMSFQRPKVGQDTRYEVVENYVTGNTFLYDSYYSLTGDDNNDSYVNTDMPVSDSPTGGDSLLVGGDNYGGEQIHNHGNYYMSERQYFNYPLLSANVPYLIGFPGKRYYEFDMSGEFVPEHTAADIARFQKQTISYVSLAGETIDVSDDADKATTIDGYTYAGTYQSKALSSGYVLNAAGTAFVSAAKVEPFRTYINIVPSSPKPANNTIFIAQVVDAEDITETMPQHGLFVYGKDLTIHIESTLEVETLVTIHTMDGRLYRQLYVLPGAKVQVPVVVNGVYIVNRAKVVVE